MKTVQYIPKEYIPSVDLTTLGKTFDTLEQGHKEAVKAASDLEVAMANLDLNENENEWRQQKINEIKQTVANNTIYGNSYAALDDIVLQAGNIAASQGMIGRLQAQKDFKAFQDKVNNNKTLSQDYKDYYLEINPYYYEDKIDKDGNIIGSTKWTPNDTPTNIVPLNTLMQQGLSWAAKESGGGIVTRWIDASGNVTTDPSKAFDGEVFNTTTGSWERLSKEKIWQGVKASIESTPGAKESLEQDYKIALWKHNKEIKNNNKPVIDDITDKNGIILTPEQYLFKRIDPMVQAASYYNSTSQTTYGKGLSTYNAARAKLAVEQNATELSLKNASMVGTDALIEVKNNAAASYLNAKNITSKAIKDAYKALTGKDVIELNSDIIYNLEDKLNNSNIPQSAKLNTLRNIRLYKEAELNLQAFTANMNNKDKADFNFATRIASGGELLNSQNGGSKLDDKAIKNINNLYGDKGAYIKISLSPKTAPIFNNIIKGDKYSGFENLGISINNGVVTIPKSSMNALPLISSAITKAEERANVGWWPTVYSLINKDSRYKVDVYDNNGNIINPIAKYDPYATNKNLVNFRSLASIYDEADKINSNITKKYQINPTSNIYSSLNLDGGTFTEGSLREQWLAGLIDNTSYKKEVDYFTKSRDREIINTEFSQLQMYYLGDGIYKKEVADPKERFNLGQEIISAVKDNRCEVVPSIVPGSFNAFGGNPISGYNITIVPKKNSKGESLGEIKKFYVPNMVLESVTEQIMKSPNIQAWNTVATVGGTRTTKIVTDNNTNPILGTLTLTGYGQDMFSINFLGNDVSVSQQEAVDFITAINNYNGVKDRYKSEGTGDLDMNMQNTFKNSAITIARVLGIDPTAAFTFLGQDLAQ